MTFTIPDGTLKAEYTFRLPAGFVPDGAEHVDTLTDGSAVFRDERGLFQLFKLGETVRKQRPFEPRPKPKPKAKKATTKKKRGAK